MENFSISNTDLCEIVMNKRFSWEQVLRERLVGVDDETFTQIIAGIKKKFMGHFNKKIKKVHYNKKQFRIKNSDWLKLNLVVPLDTNTGATSETQPRLINEKGRPRKRFSDCGHKAQLYKIRELRSSVPQDLINAAAIGPDLDDNFKAVIDCDQALAILTQAQLSKYQYEIIRKAIKDAGFNIFPSYKKVLESKKKCYPANVCISDTSAQVPLQTLLNHTAQRIIDTKAKVEIESYENDNLVLHTKWGFDGASGQNHYMQNFPTTTQHLEDNDEEQLTDIDVMCDSNMFMTSLVPLRLSSSSNDNLSIWKNERPNSTRYCRALKFQFAKETPDLILAEKNRVEDEIERLSNSIVTCGTRAFHVTHKLYFTMIDGKVAQVVTGTTSASNCVICGGKPSELNDLSKFGMTNKDEILQIGMSTLHARIKFMEYVLHLGYNSDFKAWRISRITRPLRNATELHIKRYF